MRNDTGNAERLILKFGDRLRYCPAFRKWLVRDGRRWAVDDKGAARRLAKQAMLAYLAEATDAEDKDNMSFAYSSLEARRVANMLTMAECELVVTPDQLGRFIEECCVVADSFSGRARPLYECYRQWAEGAGENAITETLFGRRLKDKGFAKEHRRYGTVYSGIALRAEESGAA